MKTRQLGQTDLVVSPIAMGCWTIAGDAARGRQDESDSIATIHAALDNGINICGSQSPGSGNRPYPAARLFLSQYQVVVRG